jgi:uncharacterized protein (TIGR00369 family)
MQVRNPEFETLVRKIFNDAPFIAHLGMEIISIEAGVVRSALSPGPEHLQQDGYVHAGVVSTIADHTAGAAAGTLITPSQIILTSEFKIHFLRPSRGRLECSAKVLKPGRMFSVVEAEVFASGQLAAKLIATMAVVEKP